MRKILFVTGLVSCAVVVLGCPLKKKEDADAASDAALVEAAAPPVVVDAAPTPAAVTAKNTADVARFPAEAPVSDDDLKLASTGTARTSPKTGTVIATLKPGTDVTKISEYQSSILVTFADPKDANVTLLGWIGKESFAPAPATAKRDGGVTDAGAVVVTDASAPAPVDAGAAKKLTCPMGMVAVVLTKDPTCRKKCTKDSDCKGGAAGGCANASLAAGGVARVCTVGE
ncbi:MAG: hypothetical protein K0S65_196 [Labilithrix sp.]|nr:hypothetical protein [Labilithrix sp.]